MASKESFDITTGVDLQEIDNALNQAQKDLVNRYDFKGTATKVSLSDDGIALESSADGRLEAAIDVLKGKLVKRQVSLKAIAGGDIKPAAGGRVQIGFIEFRVSSSTTVSVSPPATGSPAEGTSR